MIIKDFKSMTGERDIRILRDISKSKRQYQVEYLSPFSEEWELFGGSVGFGDSTFNTLSDAFQFVRTGLELERKIPDVWLEMITL